MADQTHESEIQDSPPSAIRDEYKQLVLSYLVENGTATEEEVISWVVKQRTEGSMCDHERVRTAINLRINSFPDLVEAGYIHHQDNVLEVEFLPPEVYNAVSSRD